MTYLPISLNMFRKTYCEGMSRSQTLKAFDRFINDGTLPTKQEQEQEQDQKQEDVKQVKCYICRKIFTEKQFECFCYPCRGCSRIICDTCAEYNEI